MSEIFVRVTSWLKREPEGKEGAKRKPAFLSNISIDKEVYLSNLRLTQHYCHQQVGNRKELSKARILRSINPKLKGLQLFTFESQDVTTV